MSSEKILKKSTFGGFKKEGVLNYIEELQAEILSLKKELNNSKDNLKEIDELKKIIQNNEAETSALQNENIDLKAENEELKSINKSYSEDLVKARISIKELEAKIGVYENKFSEIEKKFSEIESAYANKSVESDNKATVMMQDAVSYSEKIILKANETAKANITKADIAVKKALSEIAVAAQKIKSTRSEYDASISTVEKSIENLSVAISEISTNLNLSFEAEA